MKLFALLLLAVPLAAQEPVPLLQIGQVAPVVEFSPVIQPAPVTVIGVSNEDVVAAIDRQTAAFLAAQECNTCGGTSNIVRAGQGVLVLIAAFMAYQAKRIADRPPNVHNDGDIEVPVTVEVLSPHEHKDPPKEDSESGS